jgi:hypothetical protein
MSGLFGSDMPAPPPPPPPPKIDDTDKIAREARVRRMGQGRGSTILTGGGGVEDDETSIARKKLLGA